MCVLCVFMYVYVGLAAHYFTRTQNEYYRRSGPTQTPLLLPSDETTLLPPDECMCVVWRQLLERWKPKYVHSMESSRLIRLV